MNIIPRIGTSHTCAPRLSDFIVRFISRAVARIIYEVVEGILSFWVLDMNERLWVIILLVFSINQESFAIRKKVCVIGAGPAGLASVKQLASRIDEFEPVVFEKNSDVGGLWIYTDDGVFDEHGLPVHSSVYTNLRTNAPKEIMAFPDYRNFGGENRSYVPHETVLKYLRNYTVHFDLYQYIQFDRLVEKVWPIVTSNDRFTTQWQIQTRNLNTNEVHETTCDAIMVCNGNLFKPLIPEITGIENFDGKVLHSHSYRRPQDFTNQTIVVLGAGTSGTDITSDLSQHAKLIYFSHRHAKINGLPKNVVQVPGVVAAEENQLILSDGSKITADVLLYCTGYEYDFPFLDSSSEIVVDSGKYVHPLYKQIINVEYPSMAFIGLPSTVSGFSIFNVQAQFFLASLEGKMKLPSYEQMLKEAELPAGKPKAKAHVLGKAQWAYYNDLAEQAGFDPLPDFYERVYLAFLKYWKTHKLNFRDSNLLVLEDGTITFVELDDSKGQ